MELALVPSGLWFAAGGLRLPAGARRRPAFRTAGPVLTGCGRLQVNAGLAGKAGQPGENIGELSFKLLRSSAPCSFVSLCLCVQSFVANRARQFADFLSEPAERTINPARPVFGEVYPFNQFLELPDLHLPIIFKKHPLSSIP